MVGLLHAMAFMVLLLIGWVMWNNNPLPLVTFWLEPIFCCPGCKLFTLAKHYSLSENFKDSQKSKSPNWVLSLIERFYLKKSCWWLPSRQNIYSCTVISKRMILVCEIIAFDGQSFTETLFSKGVFSTKDQ